MDIMEKIKNLNKSIDEANLLAEEMILKFKNQNIKYHNKDQQLKDLKEEVRLNVEKIDEIINNYNANS